jgi:predicted nucleic acid-binding protein
VARRLVKLTFVDAGVLIAAARGGNVQAARAMEILDDPEREFAASPFLRLEVLPQAVFNKRVVETAFYEAFFSTVTHWATNLDAVIEIAVREASTNGVEAMDALHVAAAASVGASELITTEKPSRSIHRARAVKVLTIHPEG